MTGDAKFSRIPARAADLELTAADWRVLHVIGLYADKAGHACPSLERIAKITRIERRHVTRSTKRLAQLGLIHYERLPQGAGGWANNRYQILYDVTAEVFPPLGTPADNCGAVTQPETPANPPSGAPTAGNTPSADRANGPTGPWYVTTGIGSPALRDLSSEARAVLTALARQYNGRNNGLLTFTHTSGAVLGLTTEGTDRALAELQAAGLIDARGTTRPGRQSRLRPRQPRRFLLRLSPN